MFGITEKLKQISLLKKCISKNKNVLVTSAPTAGLMTLAHIYNETHRTILLICPTSEVADKIFDSLVHYGVDEENILYFPAVESFVYKDVKPDFALIGERLSVQNSLLKNENKFIVATVDSASSRLMPMEILSKSIISLEKQAEVEIDALEENLIKLGYTKGEVCDHRGIYCKRGSLIDVFPSNLEYPLRINLDWDEVSEIKCFDTDTQRTTEQLDFVEIYPTREVLFGDIEHATETIEKALNEEMGRREDFADRLKENTDEALEKIKEKIFFDGLEYYLPYMYSPCYLWDYLPKDAIIAFNEPQSISKNYDALCEQILDIQNENRRKGYLCHKDFLPCHIDNFIEKIALKFTSLGFSELEPAEGLFAKKNEFIFDKIEIPSQGVDTYVGRFNELISTLKALPKGEKILFATASSYRMEQILNEYGVSGVIINEDTSVFDLESQVLVAHVPVLEGVYFPTLKLKVLTDGEVFGLKRGKKVRRLLNDTKSVKSFLDLKGGDYVVHEDYGVCRYKGVEHKEVLGAWNDFLVLEFANKTLFVSANGLDRVQKYVGGDGLPPKLSKLGSGEWERVKTKAKKKIWEIAKELVDLYAYRQKVKGFKYDQDTKWQEELEKSFPYKETKSQLLAINDVKRDLESDKPMDRLICGDVGYGKTEVAIRSAFKVVMAGRQVAVLVPTTVLADQHFNSFKERLSRFPHKIELLNRFRTTKEIKESLENIKSGKADIVVGTHRILSKDVEFNDLGLIIIDEEQRFGVKHKEKLKELKKNVDVLSLSATPIPRTLNMSLSGIREISLITDAPEGRVPIKTSVKPYDETLIANAIKQELSRGGQVFFVHNRVEDIYRVADRIEQLVPKASVDVAHGQMREKELEECMLDFYNGKINVLVSTTIIENGIDVSNANTIIIDNADKMGLAQLYQLRGRVGRSGRQAFAYLLYRGDMTVEGEERLKALKEFSDLGSGFRVAERDLEIRGAGNLLGKEQSGNVEGIGFEYYCNLLNQAVMELKGEKVENVELPPVDFSLDTYIPEDYIDVESLRIMFYKKLSQVKDKETLHNIQSEIVDRFGPLPETVKNMIGILEVRLKAKENFVGSIGKYENRFVVVFEKGVVLSGETIKRMNRKYEDLEIAFDRFFYYTGDDIIADTIAVLDLVPKILKG